MIVNQNSSGNITASSGIQSTQLRIKASGKAFKAMVDSIYRDKPGSMVRELATNALDGHRVAGNPERPFVIHLPDMYEPYFGIRDYGCSMTPDQMLNVYSVMFESSKDTSNDQTGGFGLGGKNFLAYQDSGTIITYIDGMKYDYVLMYDESGLPQLLSVGQSETTEENGVYVEVAIKDGDYHLFYTAVKEQLRWLKVKPILNNNSHDITIDEPEFQTIYGNFKTFSNSYNNPDGFWIVQGEIGYPVDLGELAKHIKNKDALEFFTAFTGGAMFFNIGDINVTLSREYIQYDSHTVASIERFISEVAPIIATEIVNKVNSIPTIWEKMVYLNFSKSRSVLAKLAGINIIDNIAKLYKSNGHTWQLDVSFLVNKNSEFAFCRYVGGKREYFTNNAAVITPSDSNAIEVYIRDISRGGIGKIKHYEASTSRQTTVYMIEHREGADKVTTAMIDNISAKFGGLEIKRVSSLPDVPKNAYAKAGSPIVYKCRGNRDIDRISMWERIYDEEDLEGGFYMTFDTYPSPNISSEMAELFRNIVNAKAFPDMPIYAIKTKNVALFKSNINFSPLVDKIEEIIDSVKHKFDDKPFVKRYALSRKITEAVENILTAVCLGKVPHTSLYKLNSNFPELNKMIRIYRIAQRYNKRIESYTKRLVALDRIFFDDTYYRVNNKVNIPLTLPNPSKIKEKYPQLEWLSGRWNYDTKTVMQIQKYITIMDGLTENSNKDTLTISGESE